MVARFYLLLLWFYPLLAWFYLLLLWSYSLLAWFYLLLLWFYSLLAWFHLLLLWFHPRLGVCTSSFAPYRASPDAGDSVSTSFPRRLSAIRLLD